MHVNHRAPAHVFRHERPLRRSRKIAYVLGGVWALTLAQTALLWDRVDKTSAVGVPLCWGLFTFLAVCAARRRVVVHDGGLELRGVLGTRRLTWGQVEDVHLVHRTHVRSRRLNHHSRSTEWSIDVKLRDGRTRSLPSFRDGSAKREDGPWGYRMELPKVTAHAAAPPEAPEELAAVYEEFRAAVHLPGRLELPATDDHGSGEPTQAP